jgi:hypothetical protein
MDTRVAAGGTPIRRYALALTPAGAGVEAAVTAASVPPLSGGPDIRGSAAAHAFTIADSVGGTGSQPVEGRLPANLARCLSASGAISLYCNRLITICEMLWGTCSSMVVFAGILAEFPNRIRPHQALNDRTPRQAYLDRWRSVPLKASPVTTTRHRARLTRHPVSSWPATALGAAPVPVEVHL